ncbi:type ISP restriction/modification enzyme [Nocardia gipuzkoensis]
MTFPAQTFAEVANQLAKALTRKSPAIGDPEANLRTPIVQFLEQAGAALGYKVTPYDEVRELDGRTRLDWAVAVNGVLTGWVEVKGPAVDINPESFAKSSHNYRQWQALKELPNLLITNGKDWRLYRTGELVGEPTGLELKSLHTSSGKVRPAPRFEATVLDFLSWEPAEIKSIGRLVSWLASLTRAIREAVRIQLTHERKSQKAGADITELVFLGALRDWRKALYPRAKDAEFADGFAQTVTFALLLAVSEGISLEPGMAAVGRELRNTSYGLMGQTLDLLTRHIGGTAVDDTIDTLVRVLTAVRWEAISQKSSDLYLHLYEDFLEEYDSELRQQSGSYYTPLPVVEAMVRLVDSILKVHHHRERGYRDAGVSVIDPAMGTGTYPLAVIRHVATQAIQDYGRGAGAEAAASMAGRLFGLELQTGPFAVAELRLAQAIHAAGASIPKKGLGLYVADTLEDPRSGTADLSFELALIARQRSEANDIKRHKNITVVIGNPPYDEAAAGRGGWVETRSDADGPALLDEFKQGVPANLTRKLKNLYTYFWRWGTWKVFESTADVDLPLADQGIVCFITPLSYTTSDAYAGMREYLRRQCTHGWIINLSPEGHLPDVPTRLFPGIKTQLAIGIFSRTDKADASTPAKIEYIELRGRRAEKFDSLQSLSIDSPEWRTTYNGWRESFTPKPPSSWSNFVKLGDLFPWSNTGVTPCRGWVYSPSADTLYSRIAELISEPDKAKRDNLFHCTSTCTPYKSKKPLPDVPVDTEIAFDSLQVPPADIVTETIQYRAFDLQKIVADSRLIDRPCPSLWEARNVPGQIYLVEQHNYNPGRGVGLFATPYLPDQHCFNGRGGRVLPLYHPDGAPNLAPGLMGILTARLGVLKQVTPEEFANYIVGVVANPSYTERFAVELDSPGIRVPITIDHELFTEAVRLGSHVRWCMSLGAAGAEIKDEDPGRMMPSYETPVGRSVPETYSYDPELQELHVGAGVWTHVDPEVYRYEVGGRKVLNSWLDYRTASPVGADKGGLHGIVESRWLPEWSEQLTRTLRSIAHLRRVAPRQEANLSAIQLGPQLLAEDLKACVPPKPATRKARRRVYGLL